MQVTLPEKDAILNWYHEPTILRLMSEEKLTKATSEQWFKDFMKWLYASNRWHLEKNSSFVMDNMHLLDNNVWHAYILSTRDYAFMSKTLFSIDFIHHEPGNPFKEAKIDPKLYEQQLMFLLEDWGEEYISRVWKYATDISEIIYPTINT